MKIAVIGAGPGGLFFAILLKSRIPSADIHVYEQNPCGATYGFGIGLAESAIHKLTAKDASTVNQLRARMIFLNRQVIENCAGEFCLELREEVGTITRLELLQVLLGRCESLSIPVRHEHRIESLSSMAGADLIVGADGANSLVRRSDEAGFGTRYDLRPNRFAWFGVRHGSRQSALRFRRVNREGKAGLLIAHYYSYTPEMWTFLPEVDPTSWYDLGMDTMTDTQRKAFVEECFDDVLQGNSLVDNRSLWSQFQGVVNERWFVGNRVLIGDALYRAHFSIGSGTRLAMEDAVGLADAISESPDDMQKALARFENRGKPRKARLMAACEASYRWYESVGDRVDLPVIDFIADFVGRTGRVSVERLGDFSPNFAEAYRDRSVSG